VLVSIREAVEALRPVASIVRLKPLNHCYMRGIDACEVGIFPRIELLSYIRSGTE
jgi:hypothetical protein